MPYISCRAVPLTATRRIISMRSRCGEWIMTKAVDPGCEENHGTLDKNIISGTRHVWLTLGEYRMATNVLNLIIHR